ncbi:hypothetical protein CLOM_g9483 [Closterium sp. NIES-68]|nr:hypothetical protein CLOM_g9483 [Closterium sp. NIES-68]GJP84871.1 hypothetical protein CLOP_g14919 [Closterium sp. NIES-67]
MDTEMASWKSTSTYVNAVPPPGANVVEDQRLFKVKRPPGEPPVFKAHYAARGFKQRKGVTLRTYAEATSETWASQWIAAMEQEMASWRSTCTYIDAVPPPGVNVVDGRWLFKVKRPLGELPMFKARYEAQGFSQREGVDFFQTVAPTQKMTTLRALLHVAAHHDYELHSLNFSTAFLQGSLHEQVYLRCPQGFAGTFPPGTQWLLRHLVYGLRQAPREWHDTLHATLADLWFFPCSVDPSLFIRAGQTPFYILIYVDDLVFATAYRDALASLKAELLRRHTYTDLRELRPGLPLTG